MRKIMLVFAISLLSACPLLLGKTYERMEPVPGGMGVIYLYPADGKNLQTVYIDKDPSTDGVTDEVSMVKKGYFPYLTMPGLMRVLSGPEGSPSCVLVAVTAGSSHWVRVSKKDPRVEVVPQAQAEKEMGAFREISRESMGPGTGSYPAEDCPMMGE